MKTEETILNYMDGTLSENESGELLHSLSVSPEKRVVLEQHIKLRELTAMAQKPVAVPQALEASMAERFPAIASYNRELAGGAVIIEQAARTNFISRMAASLAGFIAQYPVRTGFAVAAASVIGYFTITGIGNSGSQVADHGLSVAGRPSSIVGDATSSNNHAQALDNGPSIISKQNGTVPVANASSINTHSGTDFSPSVRTSQLTEVRSTVSRNNVSHNTVAHNNIVLRNNVSHTDGAVPEKLTVTPAEKTPAANKDVAELPNNSVIPQNENKNSEITNGVKDIASITPVSDIRSQNVALNNVHGTRQEQNPFRDREETSSGLPFALRVYGSLGGSFVNVHSNDAVLANRNEASALIGLDYIANPYWSFGVEGGNAAISQLITQSAVQSSVNGLPSISHVVVSNVVTSGSQFYARAVAHYTFNPYDAIHFEGTAGVGAAFASSTAPLVSGAIYAIRDFNEHVGISAGIAFAGAWTPSNAQNAAAQAVSSGNDPIGYVTTNHAATTLFTPSYAIRVGFKVKP